MSELKVDKISPAAGTSATFGDSGDTFTVPAGATLTIAGALNVTGTTALADGTVAIAELDIDGGTDIGAAIVDADLLIIDDGAGGTNRKVAASRIKTYVHGTGAVDITTLDIDGGTDIGAAIVAADLFVVDDGAGGTNRKTAASRIKTFVEASAMAVTGNVTATGTVEPAGDTASGDNAAIGYTSAEGLILTGQGSTSDVTIKNDADAEVVTIATGTTNVEVVGEVVAESFNLPITLNGTDGSSTDAGDNIVLDASASSTDVGERLLYEGIPETAITALGGAVVGADNTVSAINLKDYGEITNAIGAIGGGVQNIDLNLGNSVSATVSAAATTFQFTNPTASGTLCGFSLILTNGGSQTVNWPGSVDWAGGTAATLTASGVDILVFITIDGGTIWHGMAASADSK